MRIFCRVTRRTVPVLMVALISCVGPQDLEPTPERAEPVDPTAAPMVPPTSTTTPTSADLARALELGQPVRVIVVLDAEAIMPMTSTRSLTPADAARRSVRFAAVKQDLFLNAPNSLHLEQDFERLPMATATLTGPDALAHLLANPDVARVFPDQINTISLARSLPLIKQPHAALEGKDGAGTSVAVLDTGADYRVADLGSCTSPGVPSSTCRVAWAQDFATNDNQLDDSGKHGTNVSSIVAAVAPGTKIIALDVFDGASGYDSVIINAINWVIANRATHNIVAMNLSLGGGSYTAACPSTPMAVAIQEARNAGILAAIATGNSATTNSISSPACAPAAVSVGAVYAANMGPLNSSVCSDATSAADKVTCFSNSAGFMTLLAPGAFITAGGVTMAGTSQAAPHVAGALAVLRAAFPTETMADTVARLTSTGPLITDARNGVVKPRLDVHAAAAGCVFKLSPATRTITSADSSFELVLTTTSTCGWTATSSASWLTVSSAASGTGSATLTLRANTNPGAVRTGTLTISGAASTITASVTQGLDTVAPTGTISINEGAVATRTLTVALTLSGADASGVASMCLTHSTSCSTFEPFATTKVWSLANAQGVQTVRLFLRDTQGNTALAGSDTIIVDTVAPTGGTASAVGLDASTTVAWTAATDATSGIATYRVVFATGAAPLNCTSGTTAFEGTTLGFTHTGLTNGTTTAYRVCAVDKAGNLSAGVTASAVPKPETAGPVGAVSINADAAYTRTAAVTLTLSATDASTVTQVCLSSALPCTTWQAYATTKAFTLATAQGVRTVYALFKDEWGNVSTSAAQDTIVLDTVAPVSTTTNSVYGDASATVSWAAATDATSGVGGYRVVVAANTAPTNCTTGTIAYEGSALAFTHTGLTNGTLLAYRVCALDRAGNLNVGVTTSTQPRPESAGPVGAFTINGGAAYTKSSTVTLTLNPTDASPVTQVCVSTTPACTAWQAFTPTKVFALPSPDGNKVVYALFKDKWGNTSTSAAQASIVVDLTAPSALTASSVYGAASATVSWTASTDATSGLDRYRVVAATTTAPANCSTGTVAYEGTARSFTHTGLTNGTLMAYRVCAFDKAGNLNTGATTSTQPRPESDGPVGAFTINGGAAYTKSSAVTLSLAPTDASAVSQVCLSSTLLCTQWQAFAASKPFTLAAPDGNKVVYATFKDVWGNQSAVVASASIALDTTAPGESTLSGTAGSRQNALTWSSSSDTGSGNVTYRVVMLVGVTAPAPKCTSGTVLSDGASQSFTHASLTAGTTYTYRVCAKDALGNVSNGTTVVLKALP